MSSGRPRSVEYERKEQHGTAKTPVKVVLVTETYYLRLYEFPVGTKFASFCTDSILFPEKTKNESSSVSQGWRLEKALGKIVDHEPSRGAHRSAVDASSRFGHHRYFCPKCGRPNSVNLPIIFGVFEINASCCLSSSCLLCCLLLTTNRRPTRYRCETCETRNSP